MPFMPAVLWTARRRCGFTRFRTAKSRPHPETLSSQRLDRSISSVTRYSGGTTSTGDGAGADPVRLPGARQDFSILVRGKTVLAASR
jgi:hypothetical protein